MKKIILFVCFTACLIALISPVALAHPGKTDSQGGHTDHSTGEYHFHHGYSAHDHYDMDGDGVVDCPYNFDDQTNHDGGGGYGYTRPTEKVEQETEGKTEKETEDSKLSEFQKRYEREQKRKKISKILRIVLGICYIPIIWLIFYFFFIKT